MVNKADKASSFIFMEPTFLFLRGKERQKRGEVLKKNPIK
jgi:hypothetical protein